MSRCRLLVAESPPSHRHPTLYFNRIKEKRAPGWSIYADTSLEIFWIYLEINESLVLSQFVIINI